MNRIKWTILLAVGILPFAIVLIGGLSKLFTGFLGDVGMDAFWSWVVLCSFIYWPVYVIGVVLILLSVVKLLGDDSEKT